MLLVSPEKRAKNHHTNVRELIEVKKGKNVRHDIFKVNPSTIIVLQEPHFKINNLKGIALMAHFVFEVSLLSFKLQQIGVLT